MKSVKKRLGLKRASDINTPQDIKEIVKSSPNKKPYNKRLFPDSDSCVFLNVPLTRSHFLDSYSKGKWNLSNVPCPPCFENIDLMIPPESYYEISRLKAVDQYMDRDQWKQRPLFKRLLSKAMKGCNVSSASISLLGDKKQIVKYQLSFNISECPRRVSLDSHTVLSSGSFVVLDATKDWRTQNNPFVKGVPNIRFYAGIPLVTKLGQAIGAFSVYDVFPRSGFAQSHLDLLQQLATEVMRILRAPIREDSLYDGFNDTLISKIGRPTAPVASGTSVVYEKDGSGSHYMPNHNIRFSKSDNLDSDTTLIQPNFFKVMLRLHDPKLASCELSKQLCELFDCDYACVLEIRVSQLYQIQSTYFPNHKNTIDAETYEHTDKIRPKSEESIMTRVLGSYGYDDADSQSFNAKMFFDALVSDFGIYYERSNMSEVQFRSGSIMPFYRSMSKLVRKKKVVSHDIRESEKKQELIDVFLKSGGYLISTFNSKEKKIPEDELHGIYSMACTLRKVYMPC